MKFFNYPFIALIEKYNFLKAIYMSTNRILRCNPWFGHGGHDPVEKFKDTN